MRLLKLLLIVFVCAAGPAVAGPYDDGIEAYAKGDYATAMRLFRPFADQGDANAQNNLGVMYNSGQGVPQDSVTAMSWYRKAADQGHAYAQNNLGVMYANGQGLPQDYAAAMSWYRKAADQGDDAAQFNLGVMYEKGQGLPQDYVLAHTWFSLAASGSNEDAVKQRDTIAKKMMPAQIAEAQKMAAEWKPKPNR